MVKKNESDYSATESPTALETRTEGRKADQSRRILPAHVKIIHDGRGDDPPFEMGLDTKANRLVIGFREEPGFDVKEKLERHGFEYSETKRLWHTPATPVGREAAYHAANEISGKDIRYGFAR